jgi:DNA-binding beta-propeller fold protein YncE
VSGMTGRGLRVLGALLLACMAACTRSNPEVRPEGMTGRASDGAYLYALDDERDLLSVTDGRGELLAEVPVGKAPERLEVGSDGTVYVINRGSRSLSVVPPGPPWREAARIQVGIEPVGLAVSADATMVYVVNSASSDSSLVGTLTAVDAKTLSVRWSVAVGEDPKSITLVSPDRAEILHHKGDRKLEIDLRTGRIVRTEVAARKPKPPRRVNVASYSRR